MMRAAVAGQTIELFPRDLAGARLNGARPGSRRTRRLSALATYGQAFLVQDWLG